MTFSIKEPCFLKLTSIQIHEDFIQFHVWIIHAFDNHWISIRVHGTTWFYSWKRNEPFGNYNNVFKKL